VSFRLPPLGEAASGLRRSLPLAGGVAAALLVVFAAWVWFNWAGPGPARQDTTVVLNRGGGVAEIAGELQQAHVIRSGGLFRLFAKLSGDDRKIRAGEYDFPAHASLADVLKMMAEGRIVRHWITIPEGMSSAEVADRLKASDVLDGPVPTPPEGSVLPQTYEVTRGEARQQVVAAMLQERDALLDRLWDHRAPNLPVHTPEEAVILASIVEKETGVPSERAQVAAVYENRLNKGMRLEADPVVAYGVSGGRPLGHGLTKDELARITPYNSYRVAGLPPTPIANPGEASIEAVLHPAKSDALFFVANGTGGHSFSATFGEHAHNVERWRQIESSRKPQGVTTRTTNRAQTVRRTIRRQTGR
jgi:UPF0755 protein